MKKQNLFIILGLFALFVVAFSGGRVITPANAQGVVGSVYITDALSVVRLPESEMV